MQMQYVTQPSDNFAERETQIWNYHPDLCFKVGQTHAAYGWSGHNTGTWDADQIAAYRRGMGKS